MTDNIPDNAPIILTLDTPRAAMLMRNTSAYSCRDFQARFDYAMAELIVLQRVHAAVYGGLGNEAIIEQANEAHNTIVVLIERSITEALND